MKPFILIKLDKEREFRISNKATLIFQEMSGRDITELSDEFGNVKFTMKDLNIIIFAGLHAMDKTITYDEVVDIIDEYGDIENLNEFVNKGFNESSFFKKASNK